MTSSPGVPMRKPEPDLQAARDHVMAIVNGSAMARRPPTVVSEWPLRPLPPELRSKLSGQPPAAPHSPAAPRSPTAQRSPAALAGPAILFAALDAVFVVVGFSTGHTGLAIGALVLFVLFAGVAGLAAVGAVARRGAPRAEGGAATVLTAADRRALAASGRWSSNRPWTGDVSNGPERGVVLAAADAAERIGRNPGWRAAVLTGGPILDVTGELERIDAQAYQVATMRQDAQQPAAQVEADWSAAVTRAAALTAYAEALDGLDRKRVEAMTRQNAALHEANLLTDAPADEQVDEALTTLLLWYGMTAGDGM